MAHESDTKHEIVNDVELKGGVKLHRFLNGGRVPFSGIYEDDDDVFEIWSCARSEEEKMITDWNADGWKNWVAFKKESENK